MIDAEAAASATNPAMLKAYRADAFTLPAKHLESAGCFSEALPLLEENVAYYEARGNIWKLIDCLTDWPR